MAEKLDLEKMPDNALQRMFENLTTEEVLEHIVAAEPERHGTSLAERLLRAKADAQFDDSLAAEEAMIRAVGGDPDELLPGNRPRWTVVDMVRDRLSVKDHLTGAVYPLPVQQQGMATLSSPVQTGDVAAPTITLDDIERIKKDGPEAVLGSPDYSFPAEPGDGEITGGVLGSDGKVYTHQEWQALQQKQCDHDFGEDPQESTPCAKCGLTFYAWAVA